MRHLPIQVTKCFSIHYGFNFYNFQGSNRKHPVLRDEIPEADEFPLVISRRKYQTQVLRFQALLPLFPLHRAAA